MIRMGHSPLSSSAAHFFPVFSGYPILIRLSASEYTTKQYFSASMTASLYSLLTFILLVVVLSRESRMQQSTDKPRLPNVR